MLSQNQPPETEIGTRSGYFTFWMRSTVATTYRPVLHRRPKARNPTANRMLFVFFFHVLGHVRWPPMVFVDVLVILSTISYWWNSGLFGRAVAFVAPLRYRSCERLIYSGLKIHSSPRRVQCCRKVDWGRLPCGSMVQKEWVEHHEWHCTWHPAGVCHMCAVADADFSACSLCGIVAATFGWYMDGGCFAWPGAVASDADGGHHRVDDVVVVECHWLLDCRR